MKNKLKSFFKFCFSFQFSKLIILFETGIVLYITVKGVQLATLCIVNGYTGGLPWISTMVSAAWAAYGVSVSFYYNKSKAEQLTKIEKTGSEYSYEPNLYENSEPTI